MTFVNISTNLIHSFNNALGGLKSIQITLYKKAVDLSSVIDDIVSDSFKSTYQPWQETPKTVAYQPVLQSLSSPKPRHAKLRHADPEFAWGLSLTSRTCVLACAVFILFVAFIYLRRRNQPKERGEEATKINRPKIPEMKLAPPPGTTFAIPVYFRPHLNKRMTASGEMMTTAPFHEFVSLNEEINLQCDAQDNALLYETKEKINGEKGPRNTDDDTNYNKKQNVQHLKRTTTVENKPADPVIGTKTSQLNLSQIVLASSGNCSSVTGELLVYAHDLTESPMKLNGQFNHKSQQQRVISHAYGTVNTKALQMAKQFKESRQDKQRLPYRLKQPAYNFVSRNMGKAATATKKFHTNKTQTQKLKGRRLGHTQQNVASPQIHCALTKLSSKDLKTNQRSPDFSQGGLTHNSVEFVDCRVRNLSPSPRKQQTQWSSPPDKIHKEKPSHSVYLQAPTGHGLFNLRSKHESKDPPGRWAGGLPKERKYEIRQKTRKLVTNIHVKNDKSVTLAASNKERCTHVRHLHAGQPLKTYSVTSPTSFSIQNKTKHIDSGLPKNKDSENCNSCLIKYKTASNSNKIPKYKTNWPTLCSSFIAKYPKKRKTKGHIRRKISKSEGKQRKTKCLSDDLKPKVSNESESKISVLPIRPVPSPMKQPNSNSVGIFELRKTTTPNLSSLCGKGAFTSYSKRNVKKDESNLIKFEDRLTPERNASTEVPAATSADTLHEGAAALMDLQHNQARHNTRFLNTSATEPQSSSNDLSLMTEPHIPRKEKNIPYLSNTSFPKIIDCAEKTAISKGINGSAKKDAKMLNIIQNNRLLHPLVKRNHARTISLSQESKSKEFDKSFSINLQLSNQMYNSSAVHPVTEKSKCELRKASPLQFEMPMQAPLYSDIIQTLRPTSKTVGPLCAKKSGMGAYLDEASKRTSASSFKCLNENNFKKISGNINKLSRHMSEKFSGNTVFRITRNRVTTLKTQQGQKTPLKADLGLMTRKQLLQQQNNTTDKDKKSTHKEEAPNGVSDKPIFEERCTFPKFQISSLRNKSNQNQAKTFRIRRNEGYNGERLQWQPSPGTNKCFTSKEDFSEVQIFGRKSEIKNNDVEVDVLSNEPETNLSTRQLRLCDSAYSSHLKIKEREKEANFVSREKDTKLITESQIPYRIRQPEDHIKKEILEKENVSLSHFNCNKIVSANKSRTLSARQNFFCRSKSGSNLSCSTESLSFISNPVKSRTSKDAAMKKTQLGQTKECFKRLTKPHVLSTISPKRISEAKYHSPKQCAPLRQRKLQTPNGRVCMFRSSHSSVLQHQINLEDQRQCKTKKKSKSNSIESKYCTKHSIKSPFLFRQESIKDNYIRFYKKKKTKLFRHEPYYKAELNRKKSHKTYPQNRNNCSPLHKRHPAFHSPKFIENLEKSVLRSDGQSSIAPSYGNRQTLDIGCDQFVCKREKKLDVENKLCSLSFCPKGGQHEASLKKSPKLTTTSRKAVKAGYCKKFSESGKSFETQYEDSSPTNCKVEYSGSEVGVNFTNRWNTLYQSYRLRPASVLSGLMENEILSNGKQKIHLCGTTSPVLTEKGLQCASGSDRQSEPTSDTFPTTKSHMTQTDASGLPLQNVAVQTSPVVFLEGQKSPTKRLNLKSSKVVRKLMKQKAREMQMHKFSRQTKALKLRHLSQRTLFPTTEKLNFVLQPNSRECTESMVNDSVVTKVASNSQKCLYEIKPNQYCFRGITTFTENNDDCMIKRTKTNAVSPHTLLSGCCLKKDPDYTKETAAIPFNTKAKAPTLDRAESDGIISIKLSNQNSSLDLNSQRESYSHGESGNHTNTVAQDLLTSAVHFKSLHMMGCVENTQENAPGSPEALSPKKSELHKMCMVRPSWKNINIEEVDRRVTRALKLRRELQLSRSSSGRPNNAAENSRSGQDDSENYLLLKDNQNQIKRNTGSPFPQDINESTQITQSASVSDSEKNLPHVLKELQQESAEARTINLTKKNHSAKTNKKRTNTKELTRDSNFKVYNRDNFNSVPELPPALLLQVESTSLDLSTQTERSKSAQAPMMNTENFLDTERPSSAFLPTHSNEESPFRMTNLGRRKKNSPQSKISRKKKDRCFLNNRSLLVGPLVQRLPQVPLSSFVEWFIETSDPKNFMTSDRSCTSSDGNKSLTLHLGSLTGSPNQIREQPRVCFGEHRRKSQNKTNSQTLTDDKFTHINQNKQYPGKAKGQIFVDSLQTSSTTNSSSQKDMEVVQSSMSINKDTKENIKSKLNVYDGARGAQQVNPFDSITSDAETSLTFKLVEKKASYMDHDNYISSKDEINHHHTDCIPCCAERIGLNTDKYKEDMLTAGSSIDNNIMSTEGQTDFCSKNIDVDGNTSYGAQKSSISYRQLENLSHQLQICSSSDGHRAVTELELPQEDLRHMSETAVMKSQFLSNESSLDQSSNKKHTTPYIVKQESQFDKIENIPVGSKKYDPGIRHILMKVRQPECSVGPSNTSHKSEKVRITLRRSSDVSGIVAKFQSKSSNIDS